MKRLLLAFACALPLAAVATPIYLWIDKDKVKHYSQDPPVNQPYQRVTPDVTPALPTPNLDAQRAARQNAEKREGEANKTREDGLKLKAETLERCAKARERISFLEEKTAHRLFRDGPDGEPVRYTDEDFAAEMDEAKAAADKNCS